MLLSGSLVVLVLLLFVPIYYAPYLITFFSLFVFAINGFQLCLHKKNLQDEYNNYKNKKNNEREEKKKALVNDIKLAKPHTKVMLPIWFDQEKYANDLYDAFQAYNSSLHGNSSWEAEDFNFYMYSKLREKYPDDDELINKIKWFSSLYRSSLSSSYIKEQFDKEEFKDFDIMYCSTKSVEPFRNYYPKELFQGNYNDSTIYHYQMPMMNEPRVPFSWELIIESDFPPEPEMSLEEFKKISREQDDFRFEIKVEIISGIIMIIGFIVMIILMTKTNWHI